MGCARGGLIALGLVWNGLGWAFVLLVIFNARLLGEAAFIAKDDAWVLLIAAIGGVALTLLLTILILTGKRQDPQPPGTIRSTLDRT